MASVMEVIVRAKDEASEVFENIADAGGEAGNALERNWGKITAAGAAAGASAEGFSRSQQESNASLRRAEIVTGEAEGELREMINTMTDHTFSSHDAAAAIDELTKRGVDSKEGFETILPVMDDFSDATGKDMVTSIADVDQVLNALDIPLENVGDEIDHFTHLAMQTDVPFGTLRRNLARVPDELQGLEFGMEDASAGIEVFRDRGYDGREAVREFRRAVDESEGDMDVFLETMGLTAEEFEEYRAAAGEAAGLTDEFAEANNSTITPMERVSANLENMLFRFGGLADAAGAVSMPIMALGTIMPWVSRGFGLLRTMVLGLMAPMKILTAIKAAFAVVMGAVSAPILIAVAAIAGLIAIGVLAWRNWDRIAAFFGEVWERIRNIFSGAIEWIRGLIERVFSTQIGQEILMTVNRWREWISGAWSWIRNAVTVSVNAVWSVISSVWNRITGFLSPVMALIRRIISTAWNAVRNATSSVWNFIWGLIQRVLSMIRGNISSQFNAVWTIIRSIWDVIRGYIIGILRLLRGDFSGAMDAIRSGWENGWNRIRSFVTSITGRIRGIFTDFISRVVQSFTRMRDRLGRIWDGLRRRFARPINFVIRSVYNNGIRRLWNSVADRIGGPSLGSMSTIGLNRGGGVPGGGPNKDTVLAGLTPGEHVWTRDEVRAAGGHRGVQTLRESVTDLARRGQTVSQSSRGLNLLDRLFGGDRGGGEGLAWRNAGGAIGRGQRFARREAGKPYIWGGVGPRGYDCSGFMSAIQNVLLARNPHRRLYGTGLFTGASQGPAGLRRGTGGFTVGVVRGSPGHMSGTLSGMNVESRGGAGSVVGSNARGADHRMYRWQYYLPQVGGEFIPGGDPEQSSLWQRIKDVWERIRSIWSAISGSVGDGDWVGMAHGAGRHLLRTVADNALEALPGPIRALASRVLPFDDGGILPPGSGLYENNTGRGEVVQTAHQLDRQEGHLKDIAHNVAEGARGGDINIYVTVEGSVLSERELGDVVLRSLRKHGRRNVKVID